MVKYATSAYGLADVRKVGSLPPFPFMHHYFNLANIPTVQKKIPYARFFSEFSKRIDVFSSIDDNTNFRLVEIEKSMIPMLESTDNTFEYRPLFLPMIFIDNEFHVKNYTFKGIFVLDMTYSEVTNEPPVKDLMMLSVGVNLREQNERYVWTRLSGDGKLTKINISGGLNEELEEFALESQKNYVRTIVVNLLDLIDNKGEEETIIQTTITKTREQNKKRVKRGKIPLPSKIFIRPSDSFRTVVEEFNSHEGTSHRYRYMVRGHFRRYKSERFKNLENKKKWIKPHYRGKGITILKGYKVRGKQE